MKKFDIPEHYRSSIISIIKERRKKEDPSKKDFSPASIDFGTVEFLIARHFGFCYGVENAIEIAYKTINENKGKNIYFLSEMIHNPAVNNDLKEHGIKFIMDNYGGQYIPWDEIKGNDIVIIPAFGTTVEIEALLKSKGIDTVKYNTTCPFVERVWNKAALLGRNNFTVIIHGKHVHEETRATFSHTVQNAKSVIIKDIKEAGILARIITGEINKEDFYKFFEGKYSKDFNPESDLERIGVVNQTTMLAGETEQIALLLREAVGRKYGIENIKEHFADTRDTLCYATNDNQQAAAALKNRGAHFALVIGGYNSSNTTHLVELLEGEMPVYFISGEDKIIAPQAIKHYDIHLKKEITTENFITPGTKPRIAVTSGASCPDSIVDAVLTKMLSLFTGAKSIDEII